MLLSDWEDLVDDPEYATVSDALTAGLQIMKKYYRLADESDVYFISHGKSSAVLRFVLRFTNAR
jgi:hypothetical protein